MELTGTNAIKGTFALKFGTTNPYTDISGFITLDTDALPLGIYFIRITNGTEVTTQRIVKR